MKAREARIGPVAALLGVAALVYPFSTPAKSQADKNYSLESNISDRFERGEFGEPLGEVRRQSKMQAAVVSAPQPQYVYYVVPCDTPGAIHAGSPKILEASRPDAVGHEPDDAEPSENATRDENVCVALVDESRTDSPPLLYTYDSSYRYPEGYPSHHRSDVYPAYAGSINVGYSSSRRHGFTHYGHFPYDLRHYGGFPYGLGHYGPHYGYPFAPFPYGTHPYNSPYVSHHYGFGFSVSHYGNRHYGLRHHHIRHGRLGD